MRRAIELVSAVALVIYLVAAVWLGALERSGPVHADLFVGDGTPGTFYLPAPAAGERAFSDPPERSLRPPVVLLMHGFAMDRVGLSSLARKISGSGYAVLVIDTQGHGQNRNPYRRSRARGDSFYGELSAAVDFLRASPHVDGSRLAVAGHSMGATAVQDYATRDSGIDGAVMISGGDNLEGPYQPPNALYVFAESDPDSTRERSLELAARAAGPDALELGRTYGDPSIGTAVRAVEIAGADHITILWSAAAAEEIVTWLDGIFALDAPAGRGAGDPRMSAAGLLALALLFVLPGLGSVVGRLAPTAPEEAGVNPVRGLLLLAAGLVATLPLVAAGTPAALLSIEVGDVAVGQLALCGVALLIAIALRSPRSLAPLAAAPLRSVVAAVVAVFAVFVLMAPAGVVAHRLTLTPERLLVFGMTTTALLPFTVAFQHLLRRGRPAVASLTCAAGRALVLLVLWSGVQLAVLPDVTLLMLPVLALAFFLIEVLAAAVYAESRNVATIALIDAAWVAWILAAALPIRL